MRLPDALIVGAHPDDIEIGAAALVQSAARHFRVSLLILTDDPKDGEARRREAIAAGQRLGIPLKRIHFSGFRDGRLRADAKSVSLIREQLRSGQIKPELVVVHTKSDSHNDHVAANLLMHAVLRQAVFLNFSIHLSSEDSFSPRLFVEITSERAKSKSEALSAHDSQRARITRENLDEVERLFGKNAGLPAAEAFEVEIQSGATPESIRRVRDLNDSVFHGFHFCRETHCCCFMPLRSDLARRLTGLRLTKASEGMHFDPPSKKSGFLQVR
jgi:LmbE family N-acetylglucosaminyl deacetylase